jgi:hypothetical protein
LTYTPVQNRLCKTSRAEPPVQNLLCKTCSANPPVQNLLSNTSYAKRPMQNLLSNRPPVQNFLCKTSYARLPVQNLLCKTSCAKPPEPVTFKIVPPSFYETQVLYRYMSSETHRFARTMQLLWDHRCTERSQVKTSTHTCRSE